MIAGDAVAFTFGPLGVIEEVWGDRFVPGVTVADGDEGVYWGTHPHPNMRAEWHIITIERGEATYYVPVRDMWITPAGSGGPR